MVPVIPFPDLNDNPMIRTLVYWTFSLLCLAGALVTCSILFLGQWGQEKRSIDPSLTLLISRGDTLENISTECERLGFIDNAFFFRWQAKRLGIEKIIKAGEYRFREKISPDQILKVIVSGRVVQYQVMLREGDTFAQIIKTLSRTKLINDLESVDVNSAMRFLGLEDRHAEGLFFPDTYHYEKGDKASFVLLQSYYVMEERLKAAWEMRNSSFSLETPYEVLILASIIEKESGIMADRQKISGVFKRRLEIRMRLQSDPTVIYGLGSHYDGNLSRNHLRRDSPYNTYTRHGLPPTPISNPSWDSLVAATQPQKGQELYFVARGDGTSEFSATLSEHNAAVRTYQLSAK